MNNSFKHLKNVERKKRKEKLRCAEIALSFNYVE